MVERKATHAGSWYSADGFTILFLFLITAIYILYMCITAKKLERELSKWFNNVNLSSSKDSSYDYLNLQLIPKAIIAPYKFFFYNCKNFLTLLRHAGYKYCGQTAAFAYKAMQPSQPCVLLKFKHWSVTVRSFFLYFLIANEYLYWALLITFL
jgi:AmmeMemoRadiSam system protein B